MRKKYADEKRWPTVIKLMLSRAFDLISACMHLSYACGAANTLLIDRIMHVCMAAAMCMCGSAGKCMEFGHAMYKEVQLKRSQGTLQVRHCLVARARKQQ